MFQWEKEAEQFRRGEWEADCVKMTLTQNGVETPAQFVGQGYLRQKEGGTVHYQIYPTTVTGVAPFVGLQPIGVPGVLIESHCYYQLEAVAQDGSCWQVERTIPQMGGSYLESGYHHLVGGEAREMQFSEPLPRELTKFYLTIVFFAEATIPCNARTEITTVVGGEHKQTSTKLDVAKFTTEYGDFRVSRKEGMVVVKVVASDPYPPHFETRIIEALTFVLAKPLSWNVIVRLEGGMETVRVRGKPHVIDPRLPRPVVGLGEDIDVTGAVWHLFDKYLTLVCSLTDENFHPCSRHLFAVLEASTGGMTAWGLALGVAVEGVAKAMFPDAGAPMTGMREAVAPLKEHCLAWGGFPTGELGDSIQRRLPGMIAQLLNTSAKDKLHALAKAKVIHEAHIKSWSDLRNALAHGVTPGPEKLQKGIDLCYQVTVLMYHLIFKAAGYEGLFQDYSTREWPQKRYRGRPGSEDEIAVAAYFIYRNSNENHGRDIEHWYAGKEQLEQGPA